MRTKKDIAPIPIQSEVFKVPDFVKLTREYEEFVKFCATPRIFREIKTQKAFAQKFRINEDTLTDWKKIPEFSESVHKIIMSRERDNLAEVIDGLREKAEKGDSGAARLWLQYTGVLKNKEQK